MKKYLERFKNTGTIMSLVATAGLLYNAFGGSVDMDWLNYVAGLVCTLFIILGICNDPNTKGLDLPNKEKE